MLFQIGLLMRKIKLNYDSEAILAEAEVVDMEKLLEGESIYEQQEDQEEYSDLTIISFTFEDGLIPKKDGSVGTPKMFESVFKGNDSVFTTKNQNGYNVFIATAMEGLHPMGYIIMNSREFIEENPDGLYDIWCKLLDEIKS